MRRERADSQQWDVASLAADADLIRGVEQSREDRKHGRIYGKEGELDYLRSKVPNLGFREFLLVLL